jgi:hypothetical protein
VECRNAVWKAASRLYPGQFAEPVGIPLATEVNIADMDVLNDRHHQASLDGACAVQHNPNVSSIFSKR